MFLLSSKTAKQAAVALGLSALTLAASAPAADWPQYLGPARNAVAPEKSLARTWPAEGPKVLWAIPMGEGFGAPAVFGGQIYVLDRVGSDKDVARCLDLATGQEKWRTEYEAKGGNLGGFPGSRQTPSVDEQHVYTVGGYGHVKCFDRATGKEVWAADLQKDFGTRLPMWGFAQSPVLYGDTVLLAAQSPQAGAVAFDKNTGKVVWKSEALPGSAGYVALTLTAIGGVDQVIAVSAGDRGPKGAVCGFDAKTGKKLWSYDGWQCKIPIPPVTPIGDGRFFITGEYGANSAMIQVAKEGEAFVAKELFKTDKCESQIHPPILYKDYLYANSNGNSRHDGMICLDLQGNLKWKTGNEPNFEKGGILLADGLIYNLEGNNGTLHLIEPSPEGYKELAKAPVLKSGKERMWAPLVLVDGKLLVRSQEEMKCLDVKAAQ
jgi:outer membrane protein assembly factor BamB